MIRVDSVIQVDLLTEQRDRITDEQMRNVLSQQVINSFTDRPTDRQTHDTSQSFHHTHTQPPSQQPVTTMNVCTKLTTVTSQQLALTQTEPSLSIS